MFFQSFVAREWESRKVGSLKRRVRSHLARWEINNCTPLRREAHLQVKKQKAPYLWSTFGSWNVQKVHCAVARSTNRSQSVQNTAVSVHFWKLRCGKSALLCGAKHISKSKCAKHRSVGAFLEVEMWKKWTPLWREARFEVNMPEAPHVWTTFGRWSAVLCGSGNGFGTLPKVSHMCRSRSSFKRGSAKMHVGWQAQYKRPVHQRC